MAHRASIQNQTADVMSELPTGGAEKTMLGHKIQVLALTTNMSIIKETKQEQEAWKNYEEPNKKEYTPYLPEPYTMAYQVDGTEIGIQKLREIVKVQSVNFDCHQAVTYIIKPNSTTIYDSKRLSTHVFPIEDTFQRLFISILYSIILRPFHYSLLAGHLGDLRMYRKMRQEFYCPYVSYGIYAIITDCSLCA